LPLCEYGFDGTDSYEDRCSVTSSGQTRYCQVVGPTGERTLVCLELADSLSRQFENSNCHPVTNPCGEGLICYSQRCYRLCSDAVNPCDAGQSCVALPDSVDGARICDPLNGQ
jgi:hypothetical protein